MSRAFQRFSIVLYSALCLACQQSISWPEGVSKELATYRKDHFEIVTYDLDLLIPELLSEKVSFETVITIKTNGEHDFWLDFDAPDGEIFSVVVNEKSEEVSLSNGHLLIESGALRKGGNHIVVKGVSSDLALNRHDKYLYSLFVPNRASSTFPCVDQPDMKARYNLKITAPVTWSTLSATTPLEEADLADQKSVTYQATSPLSTYQFSLVAGEFESISWTTGKKAFSMLHMEEDTALLNKNTKDIFDIHTKSLDWLEEYTELQMPYEKLDFVLIPGFQFGGMEHVGAIQYRSDLLILDESATLDQKLNRASLIAHECAHMWFGNLVTMQWFDDVWMKEVFANFMADKILADMFPEVNHDLRFLISHYPDAYAVDRSQGTHPIRQELNNLNNASNMYGAIIYNKAPIVMNQLELLVGEGAMRQALREYLENYAWKNASWDDLIDILDRVSEHDITSWSQVWVKESGMPVVSMRFLEAPGQRDLLITQSDKAGKGRVWPQRFKLTMDYKEGPVTHPIHLQEHEYVHKSNLRSVIPSFIQINSLGTGYGVFSHGLDYVRDEFLFEKGRVDVSSIPEDLRRGAAFVNMHEFLLENGFHPELYLQFLQSYIRAEQNDLILGFLLDKLSEVYLRFFTHEMRQRHLKLVEATIWQKLEEVESQQLKSMLIDYYTDLAFSDTALERLRALWKDDVVISGLELSEKQKERIAMNLAFKGGKEDVEFLDLQRQNTVNEHDRSKLKFLMPVFSRDEDVRNVFHDSLMVAGFRSQESWVLTALSYLHHPYREEAMIAYLPSAMEILPELQKTNGIFFPKRWLDRVLAGYNSSNAVDLVQTYLQENKALDPYLRLKVLQSSDLMMRASENLEYYLAL